MNINDGTGKTMSRFDFCILTFLCITIGFIGCRQAVQTPPVAVPEVVLATAQVRDVQEYLETDGFAKAFEFVEIPARVTGFLQERRYTPGDIVKAGTPLFLIEPAQYQAEVESAEADLESTQAQLALDDANLARTRKLIDEGAKTEEDFQTDKAKRDEAAAAVKRAGAKLATAKLNLSYTDVRSPITGKVKENLVDVGNLVGPDGDHDILTTIAGMDPIYIYFDISDYEFNRLRDFTAKNKDLPFEVALLKGAEPNKREYPFKGHIDMTGNVVNPSTGIITFRGVIPNPDYAIYSGQICYVRIPVTIAKDAVLIEEKAILTDMNNRYVFVVDEKNKAERRNIKLGKLQPDGTRIVVDGLKKDERYILVGGQKVRNHGEVKPKKEATHEPQPAVAE